MIIISNDRVSVSILDPQEDCRHFGSRYCTGGYIWQIHDSLAGNRFLSGPRFPQEEPPQFDGQGAPEAFVVPLGEDSGTPGQTVTVIGVGRVVRSVDTFPFSARENPVVDEFCTWGVECCADSVIMQTEQKNGTSGCALKRTVLLDGESVISETEITNTSRENLPLRWFPHPFFPINESLDCCTFGISWMLPENPAYRKGTDGMLAMKSEYDWKRGLFLRLETADERHFSAVVSHPRCLRVEMETDYRIDELPFWANENTFSPEPFLRRFVPPGETTRWKICYRFKSNNA